MNTDGGRSMQAWARARELALSIANCSELPIAVTTQKHPCRTIVDVQADAGPMRHVPEAWAGNLVEGRILFISSNPSLSEADDHQSGSIVERYPFGVLDRRREGRVLPAKVRRRA